MATNDYFEWLNQGNAIAQYSRRVHTDKCKERSLFVGCTCLIPASNKEVVSDVVAKLLDKHNE